MITESNGTESEERVTARHRRVVTLSAIEPGETRLRDHKESPRKRVLSGSSIGRVQRLKWTDTPEEPTALLSGCREISEEPSSGRGVPWVKADPSQARTQRPPHSPVPAHASNTRSAASASPRLRAGGPPGGSERVSHHAPGPPGGPPLHPPTKQAQAHRSTQVPARSDSPSASEVRQPRSAALQDHPHQPADHRPPQPSHKP